MQMLPLSDTNLSVIVAVISFAVSFEVNYKHAQQEAAAATPQRLLFQVGGLCFHIHHWLICALVIGALWFHALGRRATVLATALLAGFGAEGLLFRDRFNFDCPVSLRRW